MGSSGPQKQVKHRTASPPILAEMGVDSMGKILTFANQKGGTAKTTSAVTLAAGLARTGYDVLLVDLDAQGNVADTLGIVKDNSLYRFIIGRAGLAAVRSSGRDHLDVVLSNKETSQLRQVLA